MHSTTTSNKSPTSNYSPSVPISVYRELATELQAVELKLDSLTAQNQQLTKHNQQLRYDLEKAVNSVLYLQQIVNSSEISNSHHDLQPQSNHQQIKQQTTPQTRLPITVLNKVKNLGSFTANETESASFKTLVTEQEEGKYRRCNEAEIPEIGGWRLAIAIMLIMVTAFGAGYFVVRPLLPSR